MLQKIAAMLITILLTSIPAAAHGMRQVEIFDINKGCVVKAVPSTPAIQKEAAACLNGIANMYMKFNPIPDRGFMVKIPLQPPVRVQNQWVNTLVDEVILLFPEGEKPYLMVYDTDFSPLFLTFEGRTETLLKILKHRPGRVFTRSQSFADKKNPAVHGLSMIRMATVPLRD